MSSSQLSEQDHSLANSLNPESELTKFISNGQLTANSLNPESELTKFISNGQLTGQLTGQASAWLMSHSKHIIERFKRWFKRTDFRTLLLASGLTFATVLFLITSLGFGSAGIGGGTIAAGLQSILYGGLTPAGGLFATMQSMGMTGTLLPVAAGIAGGAAAVVSGICLWFRGRGHRGTEEHEHEQ